jgi:hypothetical protein
MGPQSRSQTCEQKHLKPRTSLQPRSKNIFRKSHVDPKKILLPSRHIKLGIMKRFVKALLKTGNFFKYLCKKFPNLSKAKLKEGIFVGRDIRKLMFDEVFLLTMPEGEREALINFKIVVTKFLGCNKNLTMLLLF